MEYGLDYGEFISCRAPIPIIILSQQYDFFPIEGTISSYHKAKRIYRLYNSEKNIKHYMDKDMHELSENQRKELVSWFLKHFCGEKYKREDPKPFLLSEEELNCTKSGNVLYEYPNALSLDKLIYSHYLKTRIRTGDLKERVKQVFRVKEKKNLPYIRKINPFDYMGFKAEKCFWYPEENITNAGVYIEGRDTGIVTYVLYENGTAEIDDRKDEITVLLQKGDVFILDLRAMGSVKPEKINNYGYYDRYGTIHRLANDAIMCGMSLLEMQVNDIISSTGFTKKKIEFIARGKMGLALYIAAELCKGIEKIQVKEDISSFEPIMKCQADFIPEYEVFGMARYFDVSELIQSIEKQGRIL
jgi:hypothetical protein